MVVKLVVVGGEALPSETNLELPVVLGRGREADVSLPHALVSRRHCELYESQGSLRVRDLGSLNGTFVGSKRIQDEEMTPGELLTVGTVTFRAVFEDVGGRSSMELNITLDSPEFDQSVLEADVEMADESSTLSGDDDSEPTRLGNRLGESEDADLL